MAELTENINVKLIAFYLPQFHCIRENDEAHGNGFTEWTNTKKAKPIFKGQYQPRIPLNNNYYNLLDNDVMQNQSELAQKYGIYGFCYYQYWFDGKKVLEKPLENMLNDKSVTIPFCLSWANENWTKRWDGGNEELIIEQKYGGIESWEKHLQYLVPFFNDSRYITFEGKPIYIIYMPDKIPSLRKMIYYFRKRMEEMGFKGIVLIGQDAYYYFNGKKTLFDFYISYEPSFTSHYKNHSISIENIVVKMLEYANCNRIASKLREIRKCFNNKNIVPAKLRIKDYDYDWNIILSRKISNRKLFLGAFTDWDNTPRKKSGMAYYGSTPQKFGSYLRKLMNKASNENKHSIIFINAWNEWAEGAYLEPDERHGYGYLEALHEALTSHEEKRKNCEILNEKIFLPLHFDSDNRGNEGITKGTASILGLDKSQVIAQTNNILADVHCGLSLMVTLHEVTNVRISILGRAINKLIMILLFSNKSKRNFIYYLRYSKYLREIPREAIVFSTGGDAFCYQSNQVVFINNYLKRRGVKTILWGCSIGKENMTPEKMKTLKKFDAITARESVTEQYLRDVGIKNVYLYPDPAFVLRAEECELPKCFNNNVVGINLGSFDGQDVNINNTFGRNVINLIEYILTETKYSILLIPHVLWDGQDDRVICKEFISYYQNENRISILESDKLNYCQIRYVISQCIFFIGVRTHAMISAYAMQVPALALGYSTKSIGIAKDIGLNEKHVVDFRTSKTDKDILDSFQYLVSNESEIKRLYAEKMPSYIESAWHAKSVVDKVRGINHAGIKE